jgi:Mn2+/Fe2+ NRAMP family transporter
MAKGSSFRLLSLIGPGLLVAATGVGAGDLATAGFAGSHLGVAILWAVALGALLKFVLTEGLARWQLITGETLLEGALRRLGWAGRAGFALYLLPWTFFVGAALISACGVTAQAMVPVFEDPSTGKVVFGIGHSAIGLVVAWFGGFRIFEKIMSVCIAVMFIAVITTALLSAPDWMGALRGLFVPTIPKWSDGGFTWTVALFGGVGGTLTVLCYGYWIREKGRRGPSDIRACRIDLGVGYVATALFGLAMVLIASGTTVEGSGAGLVTTLANQLDATLGPLGRWIFLIGAWAAVFSSLLGVWQAVPYVFADFFSLCMRPAKVREPVNTKSAPYRVYLVALAVIPLFQVHQGFRDVQKYYAVIGAAFIPMLALALLMLNGRRELMGDRRNRPVTTIVLIATLILSALAGGLQVYRQWS